MSRGRAPGSGFPRLDERAREKQRVALKAAGRARQASGGTLSDRLAAGVDRSGGPEACWPWTGWKNPKGYGRIYYGDRKFQPHKLALELKLGRPLAEDEVTRHKCIGSPSCCNPDHLQPGSIADNNRDMVAQGRLRNPVGEQSGQHRLTTEQVLEIRRLGGPGKYRELGRRFGVSRIAIRRIVEGKTWRHLLPAAEAREEAAS